MSTINLGASECPSGRTFTNRALEDATDGVKAYTLVADEKWLEYLENYANRKLKKTRSSRSIPSFCNTRCKLVDLQPSF